MNQYEPSTRGEHGDGGPNHRSRKPAHRVKLNATEAVNQVKDQATSAIRQQQESAADRLNAVSSAIRQTGEQIDDSAVGPIVDQIANRIDAVSDYLREHDARELALGLENWARRNPTLFLCSALAAGVLVARFLKSSQARNGVQSSRRPARKRKARPISQS